MLCQKEKKIKCSTTNWKKIGKTNLLYNKKQHKKKVKKCCTTLEFFLNVGQHTKDGHKNSNQNF
jgi:hypothetical protein